MESLEYVSVYKDVVGLVGVRFADTRKPSPPLSVMVVLLMVWFQESRPGRPSPHTQSSGFVHLSTSF